MNIFDYPDEKFDNEIMKILHSGKNVRIEKIISKNNVSDWYDQEENEWLVLLKGEAEIEYEDRKIKLVCGNTLYIPAHIRHRVSKTTDCIWLCVFEKI